MIAVVRFRPAHLARLDIQAAQRAEANHDGQHAVSFGDAWTVEVDGRPVFCGGLLELWAGRWSAWALIAQDAGPHMLAITRAIRCRLAHAPCRRIEMAAAVDFDAANRWALMLGFTRETATPLRGYLPDGRPAHLYARFKDC